MKVLFYLPVITPWWFDTIITPLLRGLDRDAAVAHVHLIIAQPWCGTGIAPQHLGALAGLTKLRLHWVDPAAAADFRHDGARVPGLRDLVDTIAPDLTLARSADFATPAGFPGITRFITEAAAPPFRTDLSWTVLDTDPFCHGHMPDGWPMADACAAALAPIAPPLAGAAPGAIRAAAGLPTDRPVLAVPLHYEHAENFYLRHAASGPSLALIERLLGHFDPAVVLAVTDHPLNRLHVDRGDLYRALGAMGDRVRLCEAPDATALLARCADAMVCDLSKSWSLAAWYGTPIVHLGHRPMAAWINAVPGLAACPPLPRRTELRASDPVALQRWFGWHLGGRLVVPDQCDLAGLLRRAAGRPGWSDCTTNLSALHARHPVTA